MDDYKKNWIDFVERADVLHIGTIVVASVAGFLWWMDSLIQWSGCCYLLHIEQLLRMVVESSIDAFALIWGAVITIVLFLCEFGTVYRYGINLKRIIRLSFRTRILVIGAGEYALLCPFVYVAHAYGKNLACLWGILCTFLAFCGIVLYIIYKTRKKEIEKLLISTTISEVRRKVKKDSGGKGYLQNEIEGLSIVDMIRHIDYSNIKEVEELIRVLSYILDQGNIWQCVKETQYEHLMIMVWTEHIVQSSGISTLCERERTEYVLRKMWEKITEDVVEKDKENSTDAVFSYTLQILWPLMKRGTPEEAEVFRYLWGSMRELHAHIIWYLLMYEEYLYYERGSWNKNHCISLENVEKNRESLWVCSVLWNKLTAWKFWRSWVLAKEHGDNMALSLFFTYCDDMKKIQKNDMQNVCSYTMRRYYWETR